MDFAALPPEVNSARMYSGPGSGPMRAAATAWAGVAAELHSTATSYESVVSVLTSESWVGPSSASMAAAVAPYVAWMGATAGQAGQAAAQATAAAAAYEAAFAMTVPPPVIAANRAQLVALVATNVLGQNTAAIAATEAHYGEMWAQDATAMYGYAGSSATVAKLTPFVPPQQTTNPAGPAGQAAAVAHVAGSSAVTGTQTTLSQVTSATPSALQGLASPMQATSAAAVAPAQALDFPEFDIPDFVGLDVVTAIGLGMAAAAWAEAHSNGEFLVGLDDRLLDGQGKILKAIGQSQSTGALAAAGSGNPGGGWRPTPVSAAMGEAVSAGKLSVPLNWAAAAPEIRSVAYALPATNVVAAPAVSMGSAGTAFSEMALAGMGGSALAGTVSTGRRERVEVTTFGERTKSPQSSPGSPAMGIAAELREFAELRDAGILTDEEFNEQKQRLLSR